MCRACWDPAVGQYILCEFVQCAGLAGTQLLGNTFCVSSFSVRGFPAVGQYILCEFVQCAGLPSCWTIHSV